MTRPRAAKLQQSPPDLSEKGARTRESLKKAALSLLRERPHGRIKVTEITRAAGVVQPTFYTYFDTIEDLLLVLAREASTDGLESHLRANWVSAEGLDHARRLVRDSFELWRRHGPVFTITDLLANQGVKGFSEARVNQMRTLTRGLARKIRESQGAARISSAVTARLAAYQCVALISVIGQRHELYSASGFSHASMIETTARILHQAVTGQG